MEAVSSVRDSVSIVEYAPRELERKLAESPPPPQQSPKEAMPGDGATGQHVNVVA